MLPRSCVRTKLRFIFFTGTTVFLLDFFGAFTHMFELDYYRHFRYPLDGDVLRYAHQIRFNQERDIEPINIYNYTFLKDCRQKCLEHDVPITPKLVFLIKSDMKNFDRRDAIRKTWGYERRFSDVTIRTVFLLGVGLNRELQKHIDIESDQYHDIIQANYIDAYFNCTIKTMMGLQWATKYCPRSRFYMFVDDDFYISTKNVLRFIRNPTKYPEYLEEADETLRKLARRLNQSDLRNSSTNQELINEAQKALAQGLNSFDQKKHFHHLEDFIVKGPRAFDREHRQQQQQQQQQQNSSNSKKEKEQHHQLKKRHLMDMELPADSKLFAGFVFRSAPHRHKPSKWYVPLAEYPFHLWPPYVTAGSYILSREALFEMYYVSMFTKHFRFDDIYLGIVALKAKIEPLHCEEFHFHKAIYVKPHHYRYVISSHGYDNPKDLIRVWTEVRAAGHA